MQVCTPFAQFRLFLCSVAMTTTVPKLDSYAEMLVNNPINWVLLAWALWALKQLVFGGASDPLPQPKHKETVVLKGFTLEELKPFNGATSATPVYMGVNGKVYDVSRGRNFYGPGGPYENFAGRDASRGLAKNSFDSTMISDTHDKLEDLNAEERNSLKDWHSHFEMKYGANCQILFIYAEVNVFLLDYVGWIVYDK